MQSPDSPGRYAPQPLERLDEGRVQFRPTRRGLPAQQNRGPKGYRRSDARVGDDVYERLSRADRIEVSEVSLHVQDGTVTFEGTVPERWMKYVIEDLASDVPGVRDIDNKIRVSDS
jgi:osmotically-inducible protein OsmY